ncbi:F-box/kelch-repeat protein At3g06240-like [Cicer arietinum]|uniref:F-box/kelch-repeat protein At3g06240-like n=1 Tax=Cicer arietinum TaxID=3827 RepID=A0A1S2Z0C4_CICAR|nr:F-box/kelch-repeat protein At3g06240-like [Cicer arietinum]
MVIPSSPTASPVIYEVEYFYYYGFGYDLVRDDYKVIRYVHYFLDVSDVEADMEGKPDKLSHYHTWEIYSLRSNSCKKLDLDFTQCHSDVSHVFIYMNGVCHWGKDNGDESYMVSFDLNNEVLCITPFPTDMNDSFDDFVCVNKHLMLLNESIAFILNYLEMTTFHISILGELGVKESWTKLFIIGPIPSIEHRVGEGKNGDLFFRRKDDEIVWINYTTQMIEELGHKGEAYSCQIVIYKESLLPIGQIND